ncbi:arfGAP with GTPase domain, ankyrin repeat and PH domain 3 isoform X6 [Hippocampus comes]|nr:PREDICTED: uncharacterized protein LOC109521264 isoform X6 [Hippocampus comes]
MLFLSSGTADATVGHQQQGKTTYHTSGTLKETQGYDPVPKLGMGWVTPCTLVDGCKPGDQIMENSPILDRWPSLRAGSLRQDVVVEENEEEEEEEVEVERKMRSDGFMRHPSESSGNSSEIIETDARTSHKYRVSVHARILSFSGNGTVTGHTLPRAVPRRSRQDEASLGRRSMSMYGEPAEQQSEPEPVRLRRPRSVCMLSGPGPVLVEQGKQNSLKRTGVVEGSQLYRTRKAELRVVDGLNPVVVHQAPVPAEVIPRERHRSVKTRPLSMTVLELRKRASDDDVSRQQSHTGHDGGNFLKGAFRWRLFGKSSPDKNKDSDGDKCAKSALKFVKSDAPKSTLSSLRRSLSMRIRRTRPRDKVTPACEGATRELSQAKTADTMPPQPFSYLTGRTLPSSGGQVVDGGMQYIPYRSRGKVKVMEVPMCPTKLTKPAQGEPSIWQLIANRFRRKEQLVKCESKDEDQHAMTLNNKSLPVAIETLADTESHKGQDSFVNSQEWTLSRSVPELKVGIVGNLSSGKSALVHRYLTGTYVQEESPEGGRFKKEIVVDGQSYLLLIRDEGGPPELQFAAWVDAVVFVFSLEDEISFQTVYNYFLRLSSYRNAAEVPMVLVGTQDAISAANPRVIDDSRARKLSNDLKRCTYYETCSTYGLNVERVFQDVAQKVVAMRKKQQLSIGPCKSLPNSPSHSSVPTASIPSVHINQAANGGCAFSDYSSSVPSTPSISQREMRIETIAASNTPTPIRKQSKRRSNIFT